MNISDGVIQVKEALDPEAMRVLTVLQQIKRGDLVMHVQVVYRLIQQQQLRVLHQQRGQSKGKGNRETHITHIQHGRMYHQTDILQQRIQVSSIHRGGNQAIKRIGGKQHKQQEANRDQTHDSQYPRHHFIRQMLAENCNSKCPAA